MAATPDTGSVPSVLPEGEPAPADGSLPPRALEHLGTRPFALYVHVPFCRVRCGYCDFNTYTAQELGGGADQASYAGTATAEITLARRVLGERDLPVETVFFGGGTPTLLPAADLAALLNGIRGEFGLAQGAEVTTEANPDSVDADDLHRLADAGFTRVSFGVQSVVPDVLRTLERTHDPARVADAVTWARAAGLAVSLDLIYGTPGETMEDWQTSLDTVVELAPDHVSAYALIVEPGTRLARQVRASEIQPPDDDDLADKYVQADETLRGAGFGWYEVSNWARSDADRCRHNLAYWRGSDWWGVGPGAHSHVGGVRWWNVKHPRAYAERLGSAHSPAHGREVLTPDEQRMEHVLLGVRLAEGLPLDILRPGGRRAARRFAGEGLLETEPYAAGRAVLTLSGRLLADAVVRDLVD